MTVGRPNQVKCRQIEDRDRDGVAELLARGFAARPRAYWAIALERMARRPTIADYPRYGHLLESNGRIVGVLLQLYFRRGEGDRAAVYCNLSSWCMDPEFRSFAVMLNSAATSRKEVTYLNVSPAPHTRPGIEALGFRRYCEGQLVCLPALSGTRRPGVRIVAFAPGRPEVSLLSSYERDILAGHAALGCRSLIAATDGEAHPFVFVKRKVIRRLIPCEQLVYCRDVADFIACAGALGRYLLARGGVFCIVDANGPLPGLVGRYLAGNGPKYFKGPAAPSLGDLSFTELTILGP
jgi:hypothetical protein